MLKKGVYPFQVAYTDSDAAGVLYYGRYFDFAERARWNWMQDNGLDAGLMHLEHQVVFPVREVQWIYKKSIPLGARFIVQCEQQETDRFTLHVLHRFLDESEEVLYAQGSIRLVCLEKGKLSPVSKWIPQVTSR